MKFAFHPEARAEFFAAIEYYENCEPGLGSDFAIEVHSIIENIISFPNAWPIIEDDLRRCQVRRFPYCLIYSHEGGVIFILAVMHMHREPGYWKERTP